MNQHAKQFLEHWQRWGHELSTQPVVMSSLGNGLTNQSVVLDTDIGKLVLRINHPKGKRLGINRAREALILNKLGELTGPKIGPDVIYADPQHQYLIYTYIEGAVWTEDDAGKVENLKRISTLIERYQSIDLDITPRDYRQYLMNYWQQLADRHLINTELERQWQAFQPCLDRLAEISSQFMLSHHDLIASNIIETDEGLRIIDWEYAHLGHPGLDRACIRTENVESVENTKSTDQDLTELIHWLNELWQRVSRLC